MSKKRILLLNYEFPPLGGGASPVSFETAKRLSEQGLKIDVVTMGYKDLPKKEELNNNLTIFRVKCLRTKKEICFPWEQLTYLISGFFKSRKLIKNNQYNFCHCHFIVPTGILALTLKKMYDLNYIITSHGSDVLGYNPRFKHWYKLISGIWELILEEAEAITTPSNFLKQKILSKTDKIKDSKVKVIPNGIQKNKFKPKQKRKYILTVSRLVKNKGVQDHIRAVSMIDLKDWSIKIVGDGPLKEKLKQLAKKENVCDKVEFLGWIDNDSQNMKDLYGHASVFVQPSYFENISISILEALSAGCEVIAYDVGGNSEILPQENLVRPKKIKMLAKKIEKKMCCKEDNELNLPEKFYLENSIKRFKKIFS